MNWSMLIQESKSFDYIYTIFLGCFLLLHVNWIRICYSVIQPVFVSRMTDEFHTQHIAGGQSSLADYCTYFVAYSDGSCTDVNSARAPDRMLGEVRGSESRLLLVKF